MVHDVRTPSDAGGGSQPEPDGGSTQPFKWLVPPTDNPGEDFYRQHRVSNGNLVEPLIDGEQYFRRWFLEADILLKELERIKRERRPLEVGGHALVSLSHAAWRLDDIGPDGRHTRSLTAIAMMSALAEGGAAVVVRLSGHLLGMANRGAASKLKKAHVDRAILDRYLLATASSNHEKLTIFRREKGARVLLGSLDLSTTRWDTDAHHPFDTARYLSRRSPTHDVGVAIEGPAVEDVQEAFDLQLLERQYVPRPLRNRGRIPAPLHSTAQAQARSHPEGSTVQVLVTRPERNIPGRRLERTLWEAYKNAIDRAERYIYIEDQFFWATFHPARRRPDDDDLLGALVRRVQDERRVTLIVICPQPSHGPLQTRQVRCRHLSIAALRAASCRPSPGRNPQGRTIFATLERAGYKSTYVHSKLLLVDDEYAIIGSANANRRSMFGDFELSVGILDAPFVTRLRQALWSEHLLIPSTQLTDLDVALSLFRARVEAGEGNVRRYPDVEDAPAFTRLDTLIWNKLIDPGT